MLFFRYNFYVGDTREGTVKRFTVYVFTGTFYDGNVTRTVLQGINGGKKLTTAATYTDDDNRLASVTDATGQIVSYAYSGTVSQMTGQPTSVIDASGTVTTSAYDNRGRITQNSIADTVTLGYTYSKGLL